MTVPRMLCLTIAVLTYVLFVAFVDARAIGDRRASPNGSLLMPRADIKKRTETPSTTSTTVRPLATSPSTPETIFCKAFVKQCYKSALAGQDGEVVVTHACVPNGQGAYLAFTYSCTRDGDDITIDVLKALGWEYHYHGTTTVRHNTVLTKSVDEVTTFSDIATNVVTSTAATRTSTSWTQVIAQETVTKPSATILSTTVIPVTLSWTSTATLTTFSTATSTTTATQSQVFIGTGSVPIQQVAVAEVALGPQRRAPSTFCLAYEIACQNQCASVSSRESTWLCNGNKSTGYTFTLACICKNGNVQTQQTLVDIVEDEKLTSITMLGTSTTYLTATSTSTVSTAMTRTKLVTMTSVIGLTSTLSGTETATLGATTKYTGVTSTVKTNSGTVTGATTTIPTSVTTTFIPTTTRIVLASTGFVHGFDTTTGQDVGTLALLEDISINLWTKEVNVGVPFEMMAVRDGPTGILQLAVLGDPASSIVAIDETFSVFNSTSIASSYLTKGESGNCGTSGSAPGPVINGQFVTPCEAFIFSPLALDTTPGATSDTVLIQPFWVNPPNSVPANSIGAWAASNDARRVTMHLADWDAYTQHFGSTGLIHFNLRFPFAM